MPKMGLSLRRGIEFPSGNGASGARRRTQGHVRLGLWPLCSPRRGGGRDRGVSPHLDAVAGPDPASEVPHAVIINSPDGPSSGKMTVVAQGDPQPAQGADTLTLVGFLVQPRMQPASESLLSLFMLLT